MGKGATGSLLVITMSVNIAGVKQKDMGSMAGPTDTHTADSFTME